MRVRRSSSLSGENPGAVHGIAAKREAAETQCAAVQAAAQRWVETVRQMVAAGEL